MKTFETFRASKVLAHERLLGRPTDVPAEGASCQITHVLSDQGVTNAHKSFYVNSLHPKKSNKKSSL